MKQKALLLGSTDLAALTVVCTDTLAQWPGMVGVGWPVPGAAQDALPRLQPRPEGAHVGLVHVVDDDGGHGDHLGGPEGQTLITTAKDHCCLTRWT